MRGFCLEVSGEFACFTRPEMKVERVSYDVITPSAARGIFTAIFWKPAISWRITKIEVLNPIRWASVRRNEVSAKASPRSSGILIEDARQQRAGLILRDVRYRLYAECDFIPPRNAVRPSIPALVGWVIGKNKHFISKPPRRARTKHRPSTRLCSNAGQARDNTSCTPILDAASLPVMTYA